MVRHQEKEFCLGYEWLVVGGWSSEERLSSFELIVGSSSCGAMVSAEVFPGSSVLSFSIRSCSSSTLSAIASQSKESSLIVDESSSEEVMK